MGEHVEFNYILALLKSGEDAEDRCVPADLEVGKTYDFTKEGKRVYVQETAIPLVETKGNGDQSAPLAYVFVESETHIRNDGKFLTRGKFRVVDILE